MTKTTLSLALLSVALFALDSSAQEPGKRGQRGSAEEGANRGPQRQGRGGQGAERDPAETVARMMQQFDKDGDQKLNATELTAMLTSMRDRRGGAGRSGGPGEARQGRPAGGRPGQQKSGAEGRRKKSNDTDGAKSGGDKPKRPSNE